MTSVETYTVYTLVFHLKPTKFRVPIEIIELLYMSSNLLRYVNDRILSGKGSSSDRDELEVRLT